MAEFFAAALQERLWACVARSALWLIFAGLAAFLLGCGDSESTNSRLTGTTSRAVADQLRPVRWKVFGPPSGRRVKIVSEVGYCVGSERPRIDVVHIVEKPRRSLITAMLKIPVGMGGGQGCAGVGLAVYRRIRLDRTIDGRTLYDASVSPPLRQWPRPLMTGR